MQNRIVLIIARISSKYTYIQMWYNINFMLFTVSSLSLIARGAVPGLRVMTTPRTAVIRRQIPQLRLELLDAPPAAAADPLLRQKPAGPQ